MTFALTVALAACGSKKEKEPPPAPPPTTGSAATGSAMTGSAGSAAVTPPPAAAADVPTEMDFEQQAKTDITDKNVDTEVKKIEADLGSGN
jgi:hypothetical protein